MSLQYDGFWKSGFWNQSFWADGFWSEDVKRGWGPSKKVESKLKKRDESILESVYELVAKLEESPIQAPTAVIERVQKVKVRAEQAIRDPGQLKELQNTQAQISRLTDIIDKHIKRARQDEDDAIKVLLEIM